MVWQPNILNNCYELSGGYAPPRTTHQGLCPWTPLGDLHPTSKPWLRHWLLLLLLLLLQLIAFTLRSPASAAAAVTRLRCH